MLGIFGKSAKYLVGLVSLSFRHLRRDTDLSITDIAKLSHLTLSFVDVTDLSLLLIGILPFAVNKYMYGNLRSYKFTVP